MRILVSTVVGAMAVLVATSADAGVTLYADFASWEAAAGPVTTAGIQDPLTDPDFAILGAGDVSATYELVTYAQSLAFSDGQLINYGYGYTGVATMLSSRNQSAGGSPNILITLPKSVTAFAVNYGDGSDFVHMILSNGYSQDLVSHTSDLTAPGFVGVVATTPFNTVQLTTNNGWLNVNDVSYDTSVGLPSPVPEASTWALILVGFGALVLAARHAGTRSHWRSKGFEISVRSKPLRGSV